MLLRNEAPPGDARESCAHLLRLYDSSGTEWQLGKTKVRGRGKSQVFSEFHSKLVAARKSSSAQLGGNFAKHSFHFMALKTFFGEKWTSCLSEVLLAATVSFLPVCRLLGHFLFSSPRQLA